MANEIVDTNNKPLTMETLMASVDSKMAYIFLYFKVSALVVGFMCFFSATVFSQIEEVVEKKIDWVDTLNTQSFAIDLDFQFHLSHKETNAYRDFRFVHASRFNYLFNHSDVELNFSQILEHSKDGHLYYNHYAILSSGLFKYRPVNAEKTVIRPLHPELLFISQNNTGRGLHWRFQAGALLHPLKIIYPKFKANLGLGVVYDWSSWEVNNLEKINAVSSNYIKEKIIFINSNTQLKKGMYQHHYEFRPMLLLNARYRADEKLNMNLIVSYQQSLVSPYNDVIKDKYPELLKIYPYIFSQFSISANIHRGFALKSTIMVDYENNNLSIYASSWEYRVLFGIVWTFSTQ